MKKPHKVNVNESLDFKREYPDRRKISGISPMAPASTGSG